jgi:hypothetical protein
MAFNVISLLDTERTIAAQEQLSLSAAPPISALGDCAPSAFALIEVDGEIIALPALGGFYQKNVPHVEQCFGSLRR